MIFLYIFTPFKYTLVLLLLLIVISLFRFEPTDNSSIQTRRLSEKVNLFFLVFGFLTFVFSIISIFYYIKF